MNATIARTAATLAAAAATTATLLTAAPAAHAETSTITDRVGDGGDFGDVETVTLKLTDRRATVTTVFAEGSRFADSTVVYFDADGRIEGPEYAAIIDADAFGTEQRRYQVRETNGFRLLDEVVCSPRNATVEDDGADSITLPVPNDCIAGGVERVRVSVKTEQYVDGSTDWAPRKKVFGPTTYAG